MLNKPEDPFQKKISQKMDLSSYGEYYKLLAVEKMRKIMSYYRRHSEMILKKLGPWRCLMFHVWFINLYARINI